MNEKIESIIRNRVSLELASAQETLDKSILGIVQDANARGMLGSGGTAIGISNVFREEAKNRIKQIWQITHRIITTTNVEIDEDSTSSVAKLLEALVSEHTSTLPPYYIERTTKYVKGKFIPELAEEIENDIKNELNIQLSELELFSINYQTRAEATGSPIINVYGTAGSIQTGANSVANVNLQVNSAPELKSILEQINQDLDSLKGYPAEQVVELKEVVSDGLVELEKEKPNKARLRGALGALTERFRQVDAALSGGEKVVEWGKKLASVLSAVGGYLS